MTVAAKSRKQDSKPAPRKPRVQKTKWLPIYAIHAYRWARIGWSDNLIAKELKVDWGTLENWQERHPELAEALRLARAEKAGSETLVDYCFRRLPLELQELWGKIELWECEENGVVRIEQLLSDHGERARQQLYLHAIISCNWNPSRAALKVGVSRRTLDRWKNEDPAFCELVEQIKEHKGNFFEESLIQLIAEKEPSAIMFANRTYNAERGYGARLKMEHSGSVDVNLRQVLDLSELIPFLQPDARLAVLEAIRQYELSKERKPIPISPEQSLTEDIQKLAAQGDGHAA